MIMSFFAGREIEKAVAVEIADKSPLRNQSPKNAAAVFAGSFQ